MIRYWFPGLNGCRSVCALGIFREIGLGVTTLVIATELADNPGTSITNAAEGLATSVCRRYGIAPSTLIWVEHYTHPKASWSLVTFKWDGQRFLAPSWRAMTADDFHELGLDVPPGVRS